jgi:hypothetical protein
MDSKMNRYNNEVIGKDVNLKEKNSCPVPFYYMESSSQSSE